MHQGCASTSPSHDRTNSGSNLSGHVDNACRDVANAYCRFGAAISIHRW